MSFWLITWMWAYLHWWTVPVVLVLGMATGIKYMLDREWQREQEKEQVLRRAGSVHPGPGGSVRRYGASAREGVDQSRTGLD